MMKTKFGLLVEFEPEVRPELVHVELALSLQLATVLRHRNKSLIRERMVNISN